MEVELGVEAYPQHGPPHETLDAGDVSEAHQDLLAAERAMEAHVPLCQVELPARGGPSPWGGCQPGRML